MTIPLILLAIPSIFLGLLLGLPFGDSRIHQWLAPVFDEGVHTIEELAPPERRRSAIRHRRLPDRRECRGGVAGILAAWRLFGAELPGIRLSPRPERVRQLSARLPFLYRASLNKWWFDDLNHLLFIVIGGRVAAFLWWFDRVVVDGTVNGIGALTVGAGRELRLVQTGRVQNYALGIAVGLIVMAGSYLILAGR